MAEKQKEKKGCIIVINVKPMDNTKISRIIIVKKEERNRQINRQIKIDKITKYKRFGNRRGKLGENIC